MAGGGAPAPLAGAPLLGYMATRADGQAARRSGRTGFVFTMFPLLTVSLVLYGVTTLASGGSAWTGAQLIELVMVSGNRWVISYGDGFLMMSLVFLFIEILRATKTGTDSLLNHALSAVVFIAALLMFVVLDGYGNSVFFIFVMMTALDFMAGFIVTTVTARRDFGVSGGLG